MKTKPWRKQEPKEAQALRLLKRCSGMMGYLANFHSLMKKRKRKRMPKMIRQIV